MSMTQNCKLLIFNGAFPIAQFVKPSPLFYFSSLSPDFCFVLQHVLAIMITLIGLYLHLHLQDLGSIMYDTAFNAEANKIT